MYVLDFLKGFPNEKNDIATFEYRFLCSGELYRGSVLTWDWRKSAITRIVLDSPRSMPIRHRV